MACARYRDALSEHAAGSPAPALEAHLPMCVDCRNELAVMRRMLAVADQQLAYLPKAEPSGNFVPQLRAAVIEAAARPVSRVAWRWPALATTAGIVLAFALFSVMRPSHEITAQVDVPSVPASALTAPREPASPPAIVARADRGTDTPPPRRRATRRTPAEPEVLIPPGEAQALLQWVALVNREHRVSTLLAAADASPSQTATLANIEIKPIEIVPLDPAINSGT